MCAEERRHLVFEASSLRLRLELRTVALVALLAELRLCRLELDQRRVVRRAQPLQLALGCSFELVVLLHAVAARALQRLAVDTHAPSEYRVNGPLANMSEFHAAFGVVRGDGMYVPEEDRVDVW